MEEASAESWLKKGDEFFQQKRYDEALESYLNATDINPELPAAWHNMGLICQILGQQEEAETCFEKARSEQQKANIEHIHMNTSEIPQEIIVENPEPPNLENLEELYLIGINLSRNGRLDEALSTFEHVILFNPSDYRVWNSKGITLVKLGRHQDANKTFNQALIINPSYQPAINNLNRLQKILTVPAPKKRRAIRRIRATTRTPRKQIDRLLQEYYRNKATKKMNLGKNTFIPGYNREGQDS